MTEVYRTKSLSQGNDSVLVLVTELELELVRVLFHSLSIKITALYEHDRSIEGNTSLPLREDIYEAWPAQV